MNRARHLLLALVLLLPLVAGAAKGGLLDRSFRPLAGKTPVNLQQAYGGKVLLVVNTARYAGKGFAVLGFPSGDFMEQEFTDEKKIQEFCTLTYGVKFPMFAKTHVKGKDADPFYKELAAKTGEAPKWNFHKYLVARDGRTVKAFGSRTAPDDKALVAAIEAALAVPAIPATPAR